MRYRCISWRQTGGCSADGTREPNKDRPASNPWTARSSCSKRIPSNLPYRSAGSRPHLNNFSRTIYDFQRFWDVATVDHQPLPSMVQDQTCRALIDPRSSGYCECGGGRIIRKPGCAHGEWAEPFTCLDECAGRDRTWAAGVNFWDSVSTCFQQNLMGHVG